MCIQRIHVQSIASPSLSITPYSETIRFLTVAWSQMTIYHAIEVLIWRKVNFSLQVMKFYVSSDFWFRTCTLGNGHWPVNNSLLISLAISSTTLVVIIIVLNIFVDKFWNFPGQIHHKHSTQHSMWWLILPNIYNKTYLWLWGLLILWGTIVDNRVMYRQPASQPAQPELIIMRIESIRVILFAVTLVDCNITFF